MTNNQTKPPIDEDDDMANELYYLRSAYNENDGRDWVTGKKLTEDDHLMMGFIEE